MVWPIVGFAIGLSIGGLAHWWRTRALKSERTRLQIEITNLEYEIARLKEFNNYCLSHAAGVLLTWEDYKQEHGLD